MPQVPTTIVDERLAAFIEQGQELLDRARMVGDISDYKSWQADRSHWVEFTAQGVGFLYGGPAEATRFKSVASARTGASWQAEYASDLECVRAAINVLVSLRGGPVLAAGPPTHERPPELAREPADGIESSPPPPGAVEFVREARVGFADDLADGPADEAELAPDPPLAVELAQDSGRSALVREPSDAADLASRATHGSASSMSDAAPGEPRSKQLGKRVFLVHGMNEKWKQRVVRMLELTGPHEVTILHERPSEGRTLIEQAAGSGYAIVLLTADEVGAARVGGHEPYYSPRARQSVVFEMGLLVGVLTPRYVCVLYERGVDLPSEVYGLAYVLLDMAGAWQSKLLMQLRSAGFDYDVDKLASV
jgi:predicted nucleotide-binding protein